MGVILTVLFLACGASAAMATFYKRRFEETIAVSFMGISLMLYFGGLFNLLEGFFWMSVSFLIILWLICFIGMFKYSKNFFNYFITPGFIIFMCFFLLLIILQDNLLLLNWDEFSHWALTAKSTYYLNQLSSLPNTQVMFKDYPPGSALFEYFWVKFTGFKESSLVMAYSTLLLSMLIIGTKKISWKNWKRGIIYIVLILPIPLIFYANAYASILIDPLLGITFSYGLISLFIEERIDLFISFRTAITLSFLILLKSTGILGAVFILIFAYLDRQLNNKSYKKSAYLILFVFPIITQVSWKVHLYLNKVTATFYTDDAFINKVISCLLGRGPEYYKFVMISFIKAIFNKPLTDNVVEISLWTYIALFIFLSVMIMGLIHSTSEMKRYKLMISILFTYGIIYFLSVVIMYLFIFDEFQGKVLAAYVRYSNVYNLSILVILMLTAFNYANKDDVVFLKNRTKIIAFMCGIMVLSQLGNAFDSFIPQELVANRKLVTENIAVVEAHTQKEDRICLILQNTSGYDYFMIKYLLFPRYADSVGSFSLGIPYGTDDYYTKLLSVEEWKEGLLSQGFTYVYLYKSDDQFYKRFGSLFKDLDDVRDNKLFRVLDSSQTYLLEAVD